MRRTQKYKTIEHTADAAIKVYGSTLKELFINAAEGMYAMMLPRFPDLAEERYSFKIVGGSPEELLVSLLNELNYFLGTERRLLFPIIKLRISETNQDCKLFCRAQVTNMPTQLLNEMQEIKAVTYHQLKIVNENGQFFATIVFDL